MEQSKEKNAHPGGITLGFDSAALLFRCSLLCSISRTAAAGIPDVSRELALDDSDLIFFRSLGIKNHY
jgi:hypothetical protein